MAAPLPDYADALKLALASVSPLSRIETVDLQNAQGRVLATPLLADRDLPPFDRAQMDGYALRADEWAADRSWPVACMISAGDSPQVTLPQGACVAIATGAALPPGLDTVIPHEWSDRGDRIGQPVRFQIDSIEKGHAVHHRAADARKGTPLIAAGAPLRAHHLGIAAAIGATEISVRAQPRLIILTSGDEVMPATTPTAQLLDHQVRNSNGPMLTALLSRMGCAVLQHQHVRDDLHQTIHAVGDAIAHADLVITVGGVSAGDRDHFPAAFDAHHIVRSLQGAAIQPGRPILVGRAPTRATVVALPGNPVSSLACACLFAWPIVRVMLGLDQALPWREVTLAAPIKPNPQRRAFRPAVLRDSYHAIVPTWAGSGDLAHTVATDGLLELPMQTVEVTAGTPLRFLPWP